VKGIAVLLMLQYSIIILAALLSACMFADPVVLVYNSICMYFIFCKVEWYIQAIA